MTVPKNFEAIFLAAAVLATFGAYATAEVQAVRSAPAITSAVAADGKVAVVVVKAKRMTAAEKAATN